MKKRNLILIQGVLFLFFMINQNSTNIFQFLNSKEIFRRIKEISLILNREGILANPEEEIGIFEDFFEMRDTLGKLFINQDDLVLYQKSPDLKEEDLRALRSYGARLISFDFNQEIEKLSRDLEE